MLTATSTKSEVVYPARLFIANHPITPVPSMTELRPTVSRQSEKFLIGQSRKFRLTAENWKGGTNRDEPGGTRLAGVAKESAGRGGHAAASRCEDGRERSLGAKAAGADEDRWRRRCGTRTAGTVVESADRRADAGACHRV